MKRKLFLMFLCLCGGFMAHAQSISSVTPTQNPVMEGATLMVGISGTNTNFAQGSGTYVYADIGGAYVPCYQVGPWTDTSLNTQFYLSCGVCGTATIFVHSSVDGLLSYPNAFDVTCAQINSVSPSTISAGQNLPIGISGAGIDFSQGSSTVFFRNSNSGQNIYPSGYNGFTQDSVNFDLSIPSTYPCNVSLDVCVNTSTGCQVCLPNAMTVNGTGLSPQITGMSPNVGAGGQNLTITISGTNTNFSQGSPVFYQLVNTTTGASTSPTFVNVLNPNQLTGNFYLPQSCGTYDLYAYGLDPCSTSPVVYNNAYTVTSIYNPQLYATTPGSGMTQQTVTMNMSGYPMYFNTNGAQMNFSLVHAATGAILTGTNLVPSSVYPHQASIDFNPGASDCGSYHLVIDSVSTGCSEFTSIIDSNVIIINSPTNPQIQSIAPSNSLAGQVVNMSIVAANLDFNLVNLSDVRLESIWTGVTITPMTLTPNASNPNEAIVSFNVPYLGGYCDRYDLIIENVQNCGMTTVAYLDQFEVYCPVGGIDVSKSEISVRVYPNPMDQQATIEITSEENQVLEFYLFDMLGQELRAETLESNSNFSLERNGLPSGIYLYRLLDQKGEIRKVGKLELQ